MHIFILSMRWFADIAVVSRQRGQLSQDEANVCGPRLFSNQVDALSVGSFSKLLCFLRRCFTACRLIFSFYYAPLIYQDYSQSYQYDSLTVSFFFFNYVDGLFKSDACVCVRQLKLTRGNRECIKLRAVKSYAKSYSSLVSP